MPRPGYCTVSYCIVSYCIVQRRYRVTRNLKGPDQPSVDNRPAHRLGPVDGLRFGGSPPRQDPLSRGLIAMTGSEKASAKALPLARLRPPAFAGLRDHDRTIGLGRRFRPPAAPLLAPIEHPHPTPHLPDSMAPDAIQGPSGLSFHACLCVYLCLGAPLRDWAVCRVSPFGPTATPPG